MGRHAANIVEVLYTVGPRARWIADEAREAGMTGEIVTLEDKQAAVDALAPMLGARDYVLVKGARGMEMETVVAALHARA